MSDSQSVSALSLRGGSLDIGKAFWQQWQQNRDYLYRCCIKWMGGNRTDAEDALSRAMLKAWEKVQKIGVEIDNFKSWLSTLTHNLCVDIHRERSRGVNRVEDIELYASSVEQGLVSFEDTQDCAMESGEKRIVIRRAIDNLPTRLRETFILHFYRELSYQEIAQQQEISYQNVCKRISQARGILLKELRGYFIGEDGTDTDKSVPPTATESAIGEMSQKNAPVEAIVGETVTLSEAVEEVENVVGEESIEVARSVQHSESVAVVATSDGKLEVKSDGCRCVEAALCERLPAPILAKAQFEEKTGSWGNSCLTVQRMQKQPDVGKGPGKVQLPTGVAVKLKKSTKSKKRSQPMIQRTDDATKYNTKALRQQRIQKWLYAVLGSVAVVLATAVIAIQPALALNPPIGDALTLYGNAVEQGLCKSLSPTTQNLWVCALTDTNPDVHTTFNATTDLHFTVRKPPVNPICQGNSYLTGTWNAQAKNLTFQADQPNIVCEVNLQDYLTRLNAVEANNGCVEAFVNAMNAGKITQSVAQSYIDVCRQNQIP